ncbi:MAG: hypothetical protein ABSF95_20020 [Verrucomicrobiota bacterium]|jgi:hypothetical protein
MKTIRNLLIRSPLVFICLAVSASLWAAQAADYSVAERGPHTCTWAAPGSGAGGPQTVQIETGLNYWDGRRWLPSEAVFEPTPAGDGFVAERLQHKVRLNAELNVVGAVSIRMDDGLALDSTPVAIGLYDPASGAFGVIAALTNCAGALLGPNQVVYADAFKGSGVCASIVYSIERGTFSQDVLFTGRLDPRDWGFPTNAWIQVLTEFYGQVPQPDRMRRPLYVEQDPAVRRQMASPDLMDDVLGFGQFVMTTGHAFTAPTASQPGGSGAPVGKALMTAADGQRVFLVESLPYAWMQQEFLSLPECNPSGGHARLNRSDGVKVGYAAIPRPATMAQAKAAPRGAPKGLAQAGSPTVVGQASRLSGTLPAGVVIDYIANISGPFNSATLFSSFTNYFVSGAVYLNGAVTIEPTIFKYKTNAFLQLNSTLTCKTSQFRPAIFTGVDDDTVGDSLNGVTNSCYTGIINTNGYANPALYMGTATLSLTNFRFCYAQKAIQYFGSPGTSATLTLSHSQLINCIRGIDLNWSGGCGGCGGVTVNLNNTLLAAVQYPFRASATPAAMGMTFYLAHCTIDQGAQLIGGSWSGNLALYSTNCVYANLTNSSSGTFSGSNNGFYNAPQFGGSQYGVTNASPFQGAGAGNYYLTDASGWRNVGTTSGVPASLLADLKKRTTYPPSVIANALLTSSQTLSSQAQRDTDALDLGVHYDPIDWALGWVLLTNATLSVNPGTVIAAFGTNAGGTNIGTYGLAIGQGAAFQCQGAPNNPNWIVQYNTVQEQPLTNWFRTTNGLVLSEFQGLAPAPTINCRFTAWSMPSLDAPLFKALTNSGPFNFQDCEFHGGKLLSSRPTLNLTNCLLERVYADLEPKDGQTSHLRNCLVYGGSFNFGPTNSVIYDNLFDQLAMANWIGGWSNSYTGGYNAYITNCSRLQPTKTNDIILTASPSYQAGPLGGYYLPTNSVLINAGSMSAANVGLYHYTVTTNLMNNLQIKETNTVVDVTYHYVATDASGNPIDTDSDGTPDYLEDTNGDGVYNTGDLSDWKTYNSPNGLTSGSGLQVFTPLK